METDDPPSPPRSAALPGAVSPPARPAAKPVILLVEDDDDMRFLLNRAARRCGIFSEVAIAVDARDALAWLAARERTAQPDVIVTDLKMPGATGTELIRELKRNPATQGVPVAVLTSSDRPEDRMESIAAGAFACHGKPGALADLERILRLVLAAAGLPPAP